MIEERDPLTEAERKFLGTSEEFIYTDDDIATLNALCSRGILSPIPGEFIMKHIDSATGRIKIMAIYALTERGAAWRAWAPKA